MNMGKHDEYKSGGVQRYSVGSHRSSVLHLITFDRLARRDHIVQFVDLSVVGVGIQSRDPIEPGLVYFKEQVVGQKFGVIAWCRPYGDEYRAGINFVTLPIEQELYLVQQVKQSGSQTILRDPENVIAGLLESIKPRRDT